MKKSFIALIALIFVIGSSVKADEGMWILSLLNKLNYEKMQSMGLKITADEIYSINKSSIKDAVIGLGEGGISQFNCTAELISPEGLLLTNHHCGYDDIQSHSSLENNYIDNGYWAKSKAEELSNPGKTASFLIRIEDVTERIKSQLNDEMSEEERNQKISDVSEQIKDEAIGETHYNAIVKDFFKSNQFYLMVYETFLDVRLVGTPPNSIGTFGGETDNWIWPRHNADFCIFRVYSGPDGKPAEYSTENIPLKSKYYLPISIKGIEQNDFTMILGYPGTTTRYLSSWGVQETMDLTNAIRIKLRTKKLGVMKEFMQEDDKIFIQYTSKYNTSSNYWKYSIGQNRGLKRLDVVDKKKELETQLSQWIAVNESKRKQYSQSVEEILQKWQTDKTKNEQYIKALEDVLNYWTKLDDNRKEKFGATLTNLQQSYNERATYYKTMQYLEEAMFQGSEVILFAYESFNLYNTLTRSPEDALGIFETSEQLKEKATKFFKDYYAPIDKKLMVELFKIYYEDVEPAHHPYIFTKIESDYNGDIEKFANELFATSIFTDKKRLEDFLAKPTIEASLWGGCEIIPFAGKTYDLYNLLTNAASTKEQIDNAVSELKDESDKFFEAYDPVKDKENFIAQYKKFVAEIPVSYHPAIFKEINQNYGGSIEKFAEKMFKKSLFTDKARFAKFIQNPEAKMLDADLAFSAMKTIYPELKWVILQGDLAFQTMISVLITYYSLDGQNTELENSLNRNERQFMAALMEMQPDKVFYPDANSTMRLTYGSVGDYRPADAVKYKHYTTLKGVMEKEDPTNREFIVPTRLKELYEKKDYGRYGKNGEMPICFITNTDITGGNSGSPVINGNGELVGIAFDGNWEAMSGDIAYEKSLQKTICVDIRYVLFIIDKYAGATNLINEMKIVE